MSPPRAQFAILLPYGLGFAAGAMAWVSVRELLPEALEDTESPPVTALVAALAAAAMGAAQLVLA